jgi:hypothetical protein
MLSEKTTKSELGYCHGYYPFLWRLVPLLVRLGSGTISPGIESVSGSYEGSHCGDPTSGPGYDNCSGWFLPRISGVIISAISKRHWINGLAFQWQGSLRSDSLGPALLAARGKPTAEGVDFVKFDHPWAPFVSRIRSEAKGTTGRG